MDLNIHEIKDCIIRNSDIDMTCFLSSGMDPNLGGGWPIRLAARNGAYAVVKTLLHFGANPHYLGETGASTLQLAVYSGEHWDTDRWTVLLSCCDSSQLADGAAVAIIFRNISALKRILATGRCNTNIPTTLTGKTLEDLAKGYKLHYLLECSSSEAARSLPTNRSRSCPRRTRSQLAPPSAAAATSPAPPPAPTTRQLSPSVARFFSQTASRSFLSPHSARTSPLITPTPSPSNR